MWRVSYVDRSSGSAERREQQAASGLAALQLARALLVSGHEVLELIDVNGHTVLDSVRIVALLDDPSPRRPD